MRVEHDGEYALVASKGGAPEHPEWFYNLEAHPDEVLIQDGPEPFAVTVREVSGDEKAAWWERGVAAYPPYAEYQEKTDRQIPVFVATPEGRLSPGSLSRARGERLHHGGPPRDEVGLALERRLAEAHDHEVEGGAEGDRLALVARGAEGARAGVAPPRPTSARRRGWRPRGRSRPMVRP